MLTLKHLLSSFFDINAYSFFYSLKVYFAFQLQCVPNSSVLFFRGTLSPEESLSCDFLWGLYFYEYSRVCLVLFCFLLLFFVASVFRFLSLYLKFNFPIYSSNQSLTHSFHITLTSGEQRNWSPTKEAPDCQTNSPHQHLRKCIENSMENMHTGCKGLTHSFSLCIAQWVLQWVLPWVSLVLCRRSPS